MFTLVMSSCKGRCHQKIAIINGWCVKCFFKQRLFIIIRLLKYSFPVIARDTMTKQSVKSDKKQECYIQMVIMTISIDFSDASYAFIF